MNTILTAFSGCFRSRTNVVATGSVCGLFLRCTLLLVAVAAAVDDNWVCLQALCVMNIAAAGQVVIVAVEHSSSAVDI
ncbi:hypothetical protein Tco_0380073 [Tanacetum coccineum]